MAKAMELATQIASKPPVGIYAIKKSIIYSRDHTVADGLDHIALLNATLFQTGDMATAVNASLTKQKAEYPKL